MSAAPTTERPVRRPGRTTLRSLRRAIATGGSGLVASPSALAVAGLFYLMVTAVLSGLWARAATANGGMLVGYSAVALIWYISTSEAATIALPVRLIEEIGEQIGSGAVEMELLRPVSVLWLRVATQIGAMLPRLAVCIGAGLVFARVVGGAPPDPWALLLAGPALLLAVALNIIAQHAFAAAAFWVADAKSTWFLYQKLVFVVGGMLLPLEVFPAWLETIARYLPFMAMAYAPARLASGHLEPWLLLVQVFWLIIVSLLARGLFLAGERRLIGAPS